MTRSMVRVHRRPPEKNYAIHFGNHRSYYRFFTDPVYFPADPMVWESWLGRKVSRFRLGRNLQHVSSARDAVYRFIASVYVRFIWFYFGPLGAIVWRRQVINHGPIAQLVDPVLETSFQYGAGRHFYLILFVGDIAQLARASHLQCEGRRFESGYLHQIRRCNRDRPVP